MQTFTRRSEIPPAYTWNLESIYPSDDDWEREAQSLQRRLPELEALKGTLAQSGQALLIVLRKRDELFEELGRLAAYAHMRRDEDTTRSTYQGMADRATQLLSWMT